jgi:hypothetical protein
VQIDQGDQQQSVQGMQQLVDSLKQVLHQGSDVIAIIPQDLSFEYLSCQHDQGPPNDFIGLSHVVPHTQGNGILASSQSELLGQAGERTLGLPLNSGNDDVNIAHTMKTAPRHQNVREEGHPEQNVVNHDEQELNINPQNIDTTI